MHPKIFPPSPGCLLPSPPLYTSPSGTPLTFFVAGSVLMSSSSPAPVVSVMVVLLRAPAPVVSVMVVLLWAPAPVASAMVDWLQAPAPVAYAMVVWLRAPAPVAVASVMVVWLQAPAPVASVMVVWLQAPAPVASLLEFLLLAPAPVAPMLVVWLQAPAPLRVGLSVCLAFLFLGVSLFRFPSAPLASAMVLLFRGRPPVYPLHCCHEHLHQYFLDWRFSPVPHYSVNL
jgi:hypothetical protein